MFLKISKNLRPATLLKKRLWHRCFFVNFVKFYRTPLDDCFCLLALNSNLTGCPLYRNQKFQPGVFSSLLFIKTNTFSPEILYLNPNIHHKPTHDDSISTKKRKWAQKTILLFFSLKRLMAQVLYWHKAKGSILKNCFNHKHNQYFVRCLVSQDYLPFTG